MITFNPPLVGMVVETLYDNFLEEEELTFNPPLVGMVVETKEVLSKVA